MTQRNKSKWESKIETKHTKMYGMHKSSVQREVNSVNAYTKKYIIKSLK